MSNRLEDSFGTTTKLVIGAAARLVYVALGIIAGALSVAFLEQRERHDLMTRHDYEIQQTLHVLEEQIARCRADLHKLQER